MEIVVTGRHTEVPERFRSHVQDKLSKVQQLAPFAQRVDVEITHENNPRQADKAERVEITVRSKGPVIRAEASAPERYGALDLATSKLLERLRRARDRRKSHHAKNTDTIKSLSPEPVLEALETEPEQREEAVPTAPGQTVETQLGDSPVVIRQKVHDTVPMTVDQALAEMELVGHPFFLFIDSETMQPCAVYNRHGWTYGVIRLNAQVVPQPEHAAAG